MPIQQAKKVLKIEAEGILSLIDRLGPDFEMAIDLIMACPSRVILSGIGKSGIIGQKIAATLNSTGTSSFFLHPVEAMHGDLGTVDPRDVVVAISNSGETAELNILLASLKTRSIKIIGMTGKTDSSLARHADAVLDVSVAKEACTLGLAPTASTTAALAMGDALAMVLLDRKKFRVSDFRRNHPGGSLGERLKVNVSAVMLTGAHIPQVTPSASLRETIAVLNKKNLGAVLIIDEQEKVVGIITDGDIRRLVAKTADLDRRQAAEDMTPMPKTIKENLLAADALSIMQQHEITILPVTDRHDRLTGILHLHDLLGKGEFRFML